MNNKWMAAMTVALAAAFVGGCGGQQKQQVAPIGELASPAKAEPVQILEQTSGSSDALTDHGVHLVGSAQEAQELGVGQIADDLGVDWGQQALAIVALGRQNTGGYWAQINGAQSVGDTLYVQATVNQPAPDEMATQQITYPYAAAVVPATDATRAQGDFNEVTGQPLPE